MRRQGCLSGSGSMYSSSLSLGSLSEDLEDNAELDVDVTDNVDEVEDVDSVRGDGGAD